MKPLWSLAFLFFRVILLFYLHVILMTHSLIDVFRRPSPGVPRRSARVHSCLTVSVKRLARPFMHYLLRTV